jgi:uncharacterized small protein (DUF1192 family)
VQLLDRQLALLQVQLLDQRLALLQEHSALHKPPLSQRSSLQRAQDYLT